MSGYLRTLAALAEVNPPAGAAVRAVGAAISGDPLIGLLGWMPERDVLDVCRACILVNKPGTYGSADHGVPEDDPAALAVYMIQSGTWLRPRNATEAAKVDEAVLAWSRARHGAGRELADLLDVHQRQEAAR